MFYNCSTLRYLDLKGFHVENVTNINPQEDIVPNNILEQTEEEAILKGKASIKKMNHYHQDVLAYTKGKGHLTTSFCGYQECENADEVIA